MTKNVAKIARVFAALALPYFAGVAISLANGEMLGSEILNIEGDATYGEYLAGECVVCHRAGSRIPSLENVDKAFFVDAMVRFQQGMRQNTTMRDIASQLTDEEIAALATYFERAAN